MNVDIERLKVDESLWPDEATHICLHSDGSWEWFKVNLVGAYGYFWHERFSEWKAKESPVGCSFILRPTKTDWVDGLPPVGCECEYNDRISKTWERVFIVAHHCNGDEAIFSGSLDGGALYYGTPTDFRPIRTEAEKLREELYRLAWRYLDQAGIKRLEAGAVDAVLDAIFSKYNLTEK